MKPIEDGDFPQFFVCLPEGITLHVTCAMLVKHIVPAEQLILHATYPKRYGKVIPGCLKDEMLHMLHM